MSTVIIGSNLTDEKKEEYAKQYEEHEKQDTFDEAELSNIQLLDMLVKRSVFFRKNKEFIKHFKQCDKCDDIKPYGYLECVEGRKFNEQWYVFHKEEHNDSDKLFICNDCYNSKAMGNYRHNYIEHKPTVDKETGLLN